MTARPARTLRIATRVSALALAQAGWVGRALAELTGARVELIRERSLGDVDRRSLVVIGGAGVFVGAVRAAVLSGAAELGVHSFKDLPTAPEPGLQVAAVPRREDPSDALVARDGMRLAQLPDGARIGTGSPRRAAQLARYSRSHGRRWQVEPVRGNVDTRLRMVGTGLDAVVVAAAGLQRLGRLEAATEILSPEQMLPAPAQGALAVETGGDLPDWLAEGLTRLDDADSHAGVVAERAVLGELGAGCSAPIGALATTTANGELRVQALVADPDGTRAWQADASGPRASAYDVGATAARRLLAAGAGLMAGITATGTGISAEDPDRGAVSGLGGWMR